MKANNPKHELLELLAKHHEITSIRGSDIVAVNSKAILYLRYNKNAGASEKYSGKFWFGITKSEYDKYRKSNFFLVCACGFRPNEVNYIVLPCDDFETIKQNIPLRSGQWKFNLFKSYENKYFLQIAKGGIYDVTEYLNFFDFSPRELRKTFSPAIAEISAPTAEATAEKDFEEPSDLENELIVSARNSSNPKRLEVALERFFSEIGFKCKRIGGSGETDVLIYEPIRFIVDGKSTKSGSKNAINFTRIKGHMAKNNSEFMMIVSVGFDPAVCRDADLEKATLLDIDSAINILRLHYENIFPPYEYIELFRIPGIVNEQRIASLRNRSNAERKIISNTNILIDNMDFSSKSIDEIKGRLDYYCQQNKFRPLEKEEIVEALSFLEHSFLKIVGQSDEKFSLNYTPGLAKEKLKGVISHLNTWASK